ncbi:hyalin [Strongylocentrotus purpuratus]|uniref:HYR domain-containing protein n=1 Tax=Strongylocentrotus purpuratus TaxID=7668 RepID=A0A7M7HLK2_STRPU|nr:hyalin [Strongylocentrotus purpuratus]
MRVKFENGSRLVIFNRMVFFAVVVISLSEQTLAQQVCQDQIVQAADWSTNVTVRYNTDVTSPENVTYEPVDNSNFPVGMYPITATLDGATDCTFTLIVLANPICPTNISMSSDENVTTTDVIWSYPSENRIDLFPLTSNPLNGTTFDLGVTDVTLSLADYPEYRCTFIVEVKDEQPPWLTCPENLDVNNSAVAIWDVPMSLDNSGSVLLSSSHTPGSYFPFNTTTEITYTAADSSGNTISCSFNLTVVRDGSPEITNCPSDLSKAVPPGVNDTTVTELWTREPTATSPSGGDVTESSNFDRTSSFGIGTTRVTFTFTDQAGSSSKCRFLVSITREPDTNAPYVDNGVTCPSDVIRNAPPGTTEMQVIYDEPTFNDVVDGKDIKVTTTKESGSVFSAGTTEVLYVATDKSFEINQCIISVTVDVTEDNEEPVIMGCPGNITRWVGVGVPSVAITWTKPNATDNFEVVSFNSSHEPGSMFPIGVTRVNYTATDLVNKQDTCEFYVTVIVDTESPVIMNCPSDITEFVGETVNSLEVTWESLNITDNSGMYLVDSSRPSGYNFPAGPIPTDVTISVADEAGNLARCNFRVSISVDPAPDLMCPPMPVSNSTTPGQSYADIYWLNLITVTDNTIFTSNSTHESPLRVELNSPITVDYKVEDLRGNVRSCTLQVVANDTEKPVWTPCPADITRAAVPGTNSVTISWDVPGVTDNSGETPLKVSTPRTPQLFSGGTHTIAYIAEDGAGNNGTCQFVVTVTVDSAVPQILNCPPDGPLVFSTPEGQATAIVTWDTITATDTTDGSVPVSSRINPGDELTIGRHLVEYEATDTSGNVATCSFTVEVRDAEPPTITGCPDDIIAYALPQRTQTPVSWTTEATATDNSGSVTVFSNPESGSLFTVGQSTQVLYSARDPSLNEAGNPCSFTVTVQTADLIRIRGSVTLDTIRGNGIFLDQQTARDNLQDDLAALFRGTSLAPVDFVDVEVLTSVIVSENDLRASFTLYFAPDSHHNEEEISEIFYNALGNRVSFANGNVIVPDSFDLTVTEYRGEFTLRNIVPTVDLVDFTSCCSDPNSASYQAVLQKIYSHFTATFGSMSLILMTRILPLREGSIIVPYTLTFDGFTSVTLNDIVTAFNATVQEPTRELSQTDLFLALTSDGGIGDTVEICPAGYCSNGGTCNVASSDTYAFECSCQSGFTGAQCTNMRSPLSTVEIIGIFLGVMGLILILLVICCCCLWLMGARSRMPADEEYLVDKTPHPSMLMLPMDEDYYRPPRRQRPTITEMPEELDPRPYRPPTPPSPPPSSFMHDDPFFVPPPQPWQPPRQPQQPMILPPQQQQRRRPRSPPRQRRERPPGYYESRVPGPPPPQLSRQILVLPPQAPRWHRMRNRIDRYLPKRGPRFRGNRQPEPLSYLNELPPGYDRGPIRRNDRAPAPQFRGDYAPDPLPGQYLQGGGPIRRNGSRRPDSSRKRGHRVPEEVGEMKQRLFHEFNY